MKLISKSGIELVPGLIFKSRDGIKSIIIIAITKNKVAYKYQDSHVRETPHFWWICGELEKYYTLDRSSQFKHILKELYG